MLLLVVFPILCELHVSVLWKNTAAYIYVLEEVTFYLQTYICIIYIVKSRFVTYGNLYLAGKHPLIRVTGIVLLLES